MDYLKLIMILAIFWLSWRLIIYIIAFKALSKMIKVLTKKCYEQDIEIKKLKAEKLP